MRHTRQFGRQHRAAESPNTQQKQLGFTLIELLIVIAIILVIAGIAIPNFLRSRMAANQAAAVESVRTITTASVVYDTTWGNGYPPSLTSMGGSSAAAPTCDAAILLDEILTTAPYTKSGYVFSYTGEDGVVSASPSNCGAPGYNGYLVTTVPEQVGQTGNNSYCSYTPGVIHYDVSGSAIASETACDALPDL